MSLRQKIGQMFVCGFWGTEISDELRQFIGTHQIGGLIYFARNVKTTEQVGRLSRDLQQAAAASGTLPLWISIDQEGGMVARITEGVALMPGNMALAAAGSADWVYESARVSGEELRSLGINLNFAPVLDVNNNPLNPVIGVRSYGESPEAVAAYGTLAFRGLQDVGVAATAKHFPGHGDTAVDSHLDLPTITHERKRMDEVELVPFKKAIAEGIDAVMSAHIYFPALEPSKLPVTLSHAVLTGLLREELGYDGVVMTDCMEMKAIAEHYGTVKAAVMAVEAGADTVLISQTPQLQVEAMEALEQAVRSGRIAESRINASVRRLLALKAKRGLLGSTAELEAAQQQQEQDGQAARVHDDKQDAPGLQDKLPGNEVHMDLARRISEASITLVQARDGVLPLKRQRTLVISVAAAALTIADEVIARTESLGSALAAQGVDVSDRPVTLTEVADQAGRLVEEAGGEEVRQIVVGTYNAQFDPAQIKLVQDLLALGKPVLVAALRNPYDLMCFPEASALVAAYESRPLALVSTAKAIAGAVPFKGRLPVSLGASYPAGWGLQTEAPKQG
ncbi:beta-N-acetylhexosaminidase [Paenibacillus sp. XY044]|nr:beta-N-acetylhexosaminidase [Paenibacillus sp. XY044]